MNILAITTATELIQPGHYVTIYQDTDGYIKIRLATQDDMEELTSTDYKAKRTPPDDSERTTGICSACHSNNPDCLSC